MGREITIYDTPAGARRYERQSDPFWRDFSDRGIYDFTKKIKDPASEVLDVGSGPGGGALRLISAGVSNLTCIDRSEEMVKLCLARGLSAEVGDLMSLQRADDSIGGIFAFNSYVHVPRHQFPRALEEARRVLQDKAPLALCMIAKKTGEIDDNIMLFNTYYEVDEPAEIARQAGFRPVKGKLLRWGNATYIYNILKAQ